MPRIHEGKLDIPAEFRVCLKWHHRFGIEPNDQSIRNGTQASLLESDVKVVRSFIRSLKIKIEAILCREIIFSGIWSTSMDKGGYHVPHTHPKGNKSGVCYIEIPDDKSGLLKLGLNLEIVITPKAGKIVIFPSWVPHATTVYLSESPRLSVAFDFEEINEKKIPLV